MGSKKQTVTNKTELPSWLQDAYQALIPQAQQVSQTPYNPDTEKTQAGFSAPQTQAFQSVQNAQGIQTPYLNQAADWAAQSVAPVSGGDIGNYLNPYTQNVIDATMANINRNNALQQQQIKGNATLSHALGNSRVGVAQAELARNQDLASNQTIAGLNSANYNQALAAAQADKTRGFQGAALQAGLGQQAQGAAYQDIGGLLGIGGLQQQQQQQGYDVATANAQQRQQYPFTTTQWLAGIESGLAPSAGGTSTQQSPGPSPINTLGGLGLTAAALFLKDGGLADDGTPAGIGAPDNDSMMHKLARIHKAARGIHAMKTMATGSTGNRSGIGTPQRFANGGLFDVDPASISPDDGLSSIPLVAASANAAGMAPSTGNPLLARLKAANQPMLRAGLGMLSSNSSTPLGVLTDGATQAMKYKHGIGMPRNGYAAGGLPDDDDDLSGLDLYGLSGAGDDDGLPPISQLPVTAPAAPQPSGINTPDLIKGFEGYTPVAQWDKRQYSGGYGTKAQPGEHFTREVAERRLNEEIAPVDSWLGANVKVQMTPEQRAALTSFGYNLGTGNLAKLLPDINRGDWNTVAQRMQSFNKAVNDQTGDLEPVAGLTDRRLKEAALVRGGEPSMRSALLQNAVESAQPRSSADGSVGAPARPTAAPADPAAPHKWEPNLPLLAAGLGMLASKSPFPGVALGEGGLQGVQALMKQRQVDRQVAALKNQMATAQQRLGIQAEALNERKRHNLEQEKKSGQAAFSKNVIWGTDANGNPAIIQPGSDATAALTKLPEGFKLSKDPIKVDLGTEWGFMDPQTRQIVKTVPKNVGEEARQKEEGTVSGKNIADAKNSLPTIEDTTRRVLKTLDVLDKSAERSWFTGYRGYLPNMSPEANDYQAHLDQIKGNLFLQAFSTLRGSGAITDVEGKKATDAMTRLQTTAPSDKGYQAALDDTRQIMGEILKNARRRAGLSPAEGHETTQTAPPAKPQGMSDQQLIDEANRAIQAGKDPNAVKEQLKSWGIQVP